MTTKTVNKVNNKRKPVAQGVRRQIAAGALSAVMPVEQANMLVGYSPNTRPAKSSISADTTEMVRNNLQNMPGFRFIDAVDFCRRVRDDDKKAALDQKLAANRDIIKAMGFNSPDKIEVNNSHTIVAAINVMADLCVDPVSLQNALNQRINTPELIPNVDTNVSQPHNLLSHNNIENNTLDIQSDGSNDSTIQVDCATNLNAQNSEKRLPEKKEGRGG